MMVLTGSNNETYRKLMRGHPKHFGYFVQPRTYYRNQIMRDERVRWGMDNDAYNGFSHSRFMAALDHLLPYQCRCIFVTCPDYVGDHTITLALWREWRPRIAEMGYPVAFVAQDGLLLNQVPWHEMDALFVGGTNQFKDMDSRESILEAKRRGLWVHVGRVNDSPRRLRYCLQMGVDSIDGTAYGLKPDKMLKWYVNELTKYKLQGRLQL